MGICVIEGHINWKWISGSKVEPFVIKGKEMVAHYANFLTRYDGRSITYLFCACQNSMQARFYLYCFSDSIPKMLGTLYFFNSGYFVVAFLLALLANCTYGSRVNLVELRGDERDFSV